MKRFGWLLVLLLSLGLLSGCGSKPKGGGIDDTLGAGGHMDGVAVGRLGGSSSYLDDPTRQGDVGNFLEFDVNVEPAHRIHFDYNSALITDKAAQILAHNAGWILARGGPMGTITIEGHCDERGTREFNLALGQQRADAAARFLVAQGLEASQLQAVSYGKERPLVPAHNDAAWNKNRRVEIVLH